MNKYKLTVLDKRDQRLYVFINAYSEAQAKYFFKKKNGWNNRILHIELLNYVPKQMTLSF